MTRSETAGFAIACGLSRRGGSISSDVLAHPLGARPIPSTRVRHGCPRFPVALLADRSTPIVKAPIARQAATVQERNDGPGTSAARRASSDRRQRPQALPGRHLAAAVRRTAPRGSGPFLRGIPIWPLLVGDPL